MNLSEQQQEISLRVSEENTIFPELKLRAVLLLTEQTAKRLSSFLAVPTPPQSRDRLTTQDDYIDVIHEKARSLAETVPQLIDFVERFDDRLKSLENASSPAQAGEAKSHTDEVRSFMRQELQQRKRTSLHMIAQQTALFQSVGKESRQQREKDARRVSLMEQKFRQEQQRFREQNFRLRSELAYAQEKAKQGFEVQSKFTLEHEMLKVSLKLKEERLQHLEAIVEAIDQDLGEQLPNRCHVAARGIDNEATASVVRMRLGLDEEQLKRKDVLLKLKSLEVQNLSEKLKLFQQQKLDQQQIASKTESQLRAKIADLEGQLQLALADQSFLPHKSQAVSLAEREIIQDEIQLLAGCTPRVLRRLEEENSGLLQAVRNLASSLEDSRKNSVLSQQLRQLLQSNHSLTALTKQSRNHVQSIANELRSQIIDHKESSATAREAIQNQVQELEKKYAQEVEDMRRQFQEQQDQQREALQDIQQRLLQLQQFTQEKQKTLRQEVVALEERESQFKESTQRFVAQLIGRAREVVRRQQISDQIYSQQEPGLNHAETEVVRDFQKFDQLVCSFKSELKSKSEHTRKLLRKLRSSICVEAQSPPTMLFTQAVSLQDSQEERPKVRRSSTKESQGEVCQTTQGLLQTIRSLLEEAVSQETSIKHSVDVLQEDMQENKQRIAEIEKSVSISRQESSKEHFKTNSLLDQLKQELAGVMKERERTAIKTQPGPTFELPKDRPLVQSQSRRSEGDLCLLSELQSVLYQEMQCSANVKQYLEKTQRRMLQFIKETESKLKEALTCLATLREDRARDHDELQRMLSLMCLEVGDTLRERSQREESICRANDGLRRESLAERRELNQSLRQIESQLQTLQKERYAVKDVLQQKVIVLFQEIQKKERVIEVEMKAIAQQLTLNNKQMAKKQAALHYSNSLMAREIEAEKEERNRQFATFMQKFEGLFQGKDQVAERLARLGDRFDADKRVFKQICDGVRGSREDNQRLFAQFSEFKQSLNSMSCGVQKTLASLAEGTRDSRQENTDFKQEVLEAIAGVGEELSKSQSNLSKRLGQLRKDIKTDIEKVEALSGTLQENIAERQRKGLLRLLEAHFSKFQKLLDKTVGECFASFIKETERESSQLAAGLSSRFKECGHTLLQELQRALRDSNQTLSAESQARLESINKQFGHKLDQNTVRTLNQITDILEHKFGDSVKRLQNIQGKGLNQVMARLQECSSKVGACQSLQGKSVAELATSISQIAKLRQSISQLGASVGEGQSRCHQELSRLKQIAKKQSECLLSQQQREQEGRRIAETAAAHLLSVRREESARLESLLAEKEQKQAYRLECLSAQIHENQQVYEKFAELIEQVQLFSQSLGEKQRQMNERSEGAILKELVRIAGKLDMVIDSHSTQSLELFTSSELCSQSQSKALELQQAAKTLAEEVKASIAQFKQDCASRLLHIHHSNSHFAERLQDIEKTILSGQAQQQKRGDSLAQFLRQLQLQWQLQAECSATQQQLQKAEHRLRDQFQTQCQMLLSKQVPKQSLLEQVNTKLDIVKVRGQLANQLFIESLKKTNQILNLAAVTSALLADRRKQSSDRTQGTVHLGSSLRQALLQWNRLNNLLIIYKKKVRRPKRVVRRARPAKPPQQPKQPAFLVQDTLRRYKVLLQENQRLHRQMSLCRCQLGQGEE